MTPEELDRALEEALHVEPPAGYAARLRARVAAEQTAAAGGHAWWPLGALAASVLVLVAGGLALQRTDSPPPAAQAGGVLTENADGGTAAAAPWPTGHSPQATGHRTRGTGDRPARIAVEPNGLPRSADALPAVLISPDDAAGLQLLVTLAGTNLAPPATDGANREGPLQIGRIDVAPIEVDPLPQLTPVAIGELQ